MTKWDQILLHRLKSLHAEVRSGATEMTGKTRRDESGKIVGRFKGGFSKLFPELYQSGMTPGQAAAAIERGRGKRFQRLVAASKREIAKIYGGAAKKRYGGQRKRSEGRPTVAPHAGNKKCKVCGRFHAKGPHRFHGAGSFHQTHLFSFNPPAGHWMVGDEVEAIFYRKGQPHDCNAQCKAADHRFRHDFEGDEKFPVIGRPDGRLII